MTDEDIPAGPDSPQQPPPAVTPAGVRLKPAVKRLWREHPFTFGLWLVSLCAGLLVFVSFTSFCYWLRWFFAHAGQEYAQESP